MYNLSDFTKPVYKSGEVAKVLGITAQTVRVYENEGKIAYFCSEGGHRLVRRKDLLLLLKEKGLLVDDSAANRCDVIYVCVPASNDHAEEQLDRQALQIITGFFTLQNPLVIREIADNSDETREGLQKVIEMVLHDEVKDVYVVRKSAIADKGYGYLEFVFQQKNVSILSLCD